LGFGFLSWTGAIEVNASTSAGNSNILRLTIREELDLPTPGAAVAVTWSADGSAIAAASNYGSTLTVWDRSGRIINQFKRAGGGPALEGSIAFVHDASQLAFPPPASVDSDATLAVWDVASGQIVTTIPGVEPGGNSGLNRATYFAAVPGKELLAAPTRGNGGPRNPHGNLITYSTQDWRVLWTTAIANGVFSLCAFDDGRLLAAGSNQGQVSVLDAMSGNLVHQFHAYEESKFGILSIGAIAGSPDGRLILAGVGSAMFGSTGSTAEAQSWLNSVEPARVLRAEDGTLLAAFNGPAKLPIRQAAWDPNGRFVAFIDNANGLFLWQPMAGGGSYKKVEVADLGLSLAIAPDGRHLAVTEKQGVRIFSIN
jgi:WD40 repeat protein